MKEERKEWRRGQINNHKERWQREKEMDTSALKDITEKKLHKTLREEYKKNTHKHFSEAKMPSKVKFSQTGIHMYSWCQNNYNSNLSSSIPVFIIRWTVPANKCLQEIVKALVIIATFTINQKTPPNDIIWN